MFTNLYGDEERLPRSLQCDLMYLCKNVKNWRTRGANSMGSYKMEACLRGFECEKIMPSLARKRVDLFKLYPSSELDYRVAVEVETSTIENGYNDLLKIMQLLKSDEVDFGVILFIQNNRSSRPKLTAQSLTSNLVNGLDKVLADFRGKLFLRHLNSEA